MAGADGTLTPTAGELRLGFDAFIAASRRLEQSYAELTARAAAVDLELQATNRALQRALAERDAVFAALPLGVVARRGDGSIAFQNGEAERLLALAAAQRVDLLAAPVGDRCFHDATVRVARADLPDGELVLLEDRSRLHELEREVHRLDRLAGLSELALGVAHEIRNPLNGAMGFAALLERAPDGPSAARHARAVREGLQRVEGIVQSLLAFARSDDRRPALAAIATIVDEAAAAAGLPRSRVELGAGGELRGQAEALLRALAVLFNNAREAAGPQVRLRVAARATAGRLEVVVEDDGPGVPAALGQKVFEPFVSSKERGTGLGLALASRVLAYLGGDLALLNAGQPGARFRVRLPLPGAGGAAGGGAGVSGKELVLLADDDALSRDYLQEALQELDFEVHAVADGEAAIAALLRRGYDYVFTDLKMPGRDGNAVLAACKQREPDRPVVLVTAHGTMGVAVEAMRGGADDILAKPVSLPDLQLCCARLRQRRRLLRENRFFRDQSVGDELIVAGPAMRAVVELLERIAGSSATVLIQGESGTGKERAAALLHRRSDRHQGPFVKLNCAAVTETLLESELFGHEQGAFTGAQKRREGRFELADGGTLLLDEVGEMSPAMQSRLLRVLQEGEFTRVGGDRTVAVDVRVVAATNRELDREVAAGRFRQDLFYRLAVVPVTLPPLRQRREEIVPLARHFLRPGLRLEPAAEQVLLAWHWPGNVRELQNVVQRASLLCDGEVVRAGLLAAWLQPQAPARAAAAAPLLLPALPPQDPFAPLIGQPLHAVERALIERTLQHCAGNRTKTADMLGIGVRTLFNRLRGGPAAGQP